MRQIRHMPRLARDRVSAREIGRTLDIARSTVHDNLARASAAGLVGPIDEEITDAVLEQRPFDRVGVKQGAKRRVEPDRPTCLRDHAGLDEDTETSVFALWGVVTGIIRTF